MTTSSPVIERLTTIRATVRRRLLAYGVCAVVSGGVVAFLTIVTLDRLLSLPPAVRVITAVIFLLGFVWALMRWIVRPLRARLGLDEIAARIESHFEAFEDRLTSSVNFLQRGHIDSPAMMQQVVRNTERLIETLPLHSTLSLKPLLTRAALLVTGVFILSAIFTASPEWLMTGCYRYLYPWGEIEWPRRVEIRPLTLNRKVAIGESVTLRMAVDRGGSETLRGILCLRDDKGEMVRRAMQRDRDGTYYTTVDAITSNLSYWFEAGDDSTARRPASIHVVRRPQVLEALVEIQPPPYARQRSSWIEDLSDGPAHAPVGGHARVLLHTSKPIAPDPTGQRVGLRLDTGEMMPLTRDAEDGTALSVRLDVQSDRRFRVELRDRDGFENRGAGEYAILAAPDAPPRVVVLEPKAVMDLTPKGSLALRARVEDDFGLTALHLDIERLGEGGRIIDLTEQLQTTGHREGVSATVRYRWDLAPLELTPGDILLYTLVATDNRATAEGPGQIGRSATLRVSIISEVELDNRVREDLARLETQIRHTLLEQTELLDGTRALISKADDASAPPAADREQAGSLASGQARLIRRTHDLAKRFDLLLKRMQQNTSGDVSRREGLAAIGNALRRIASEPMTSAGRNLNEAYEQISAARPTTAVQTAATNEQTAVEGLQRLLNRMSQWGSFQELVTKTRDLQDRQNKLRDETARLGRSMLGQSAESLDPSDQAALKRTALQQEQLATDVERLLRHMKQLAPTLADRDRSGADAIDAAVRSARAHDLRRHLSEAIKAIESNRTAAANLAQKNAAEALRKMARALREREDRALAELRKQLEDAESLVAELIEEQQILQKAARDTVPTGKAKKELISIAREQRTLARNTRLLGDDLSRVARAAAASRPLKQAASPMRRAEENLRGRQTGEAVAAQDEALALLNEARDRLSEAAQEAANEALRRSLQQIRGDLVAVREAQTEINTGIVELKGSVEARGRVSRPEARKASKLAHAQNRVRSMLEEQLPDFEHVAVFRWALDRVLTWMDESRRRLTDREIDAKLVHKVARIKQELDKLIGAIDDTLALPMDTDFVESDSGGGEGAGQSAQQKPVPTVAELLVLKAMQTDINARTDVFKSTWSADETDENQLRELAAIGEDQEEVKKLTQLVLERVRNR